MPRESEPRSVPTAQPSGPRLIGQGVETPPAEGGQLKRARDRVSSPLGTRAARTSRSHPRHSREGAQLFIHRPSDPALPAGRRRAPRLQWPGKAARKERWCEQLRPGGRAAASASACGGSGGLSGARGGRSGERVEQRSGAGSTAPGGHQDVWQGWCGPHSRVNLGNQATRQRSGQPPRPCLVL